MSGNILAFFNEKTGCATDASPNLQLRHWAILRRVAGEVIEANDLAKNIRPGDISMSSWNFLIGIGQENVSLGGKGVSDICAACDNEEAFKAILAIHAPDVSFVAYGKDQKLSFMTGTS